MRGVSYLVLCKCGVLFICFRVRQNLSPDKRTTPHFPFLRMYPARSRGIANNRFMIKKSILAAVVVVLAGSCAVTNTFDYQSVETRKVEPRIDAVTVPLNAEITVLRDSSGELLKAERTIVFKADVDFVPGTMTDNKIEQFRNIALNRVAQEYKADLLVGALTDVQYSKKEGNKSREELTVRVSGYPAVYSDFKSVAPSDEWLLDYYLMRQKATSISKNVHETKPEKEKK